MLRPTAEEVAAKAIDITAPEVAEISIQKRPNGYVIWVNVNGVCALRICRLNNLIVEIEGKNVIEDIRE